MNEKSLSKYKRKNWLKALKLKRNLLLLSSYKLLADVLCEWEEDYYTMLYAGRSDAAEAFLRGDNAHILGLTDPRNLFLKTMWSGKWPEKIAAALEYRLSGIYCRGYASPSFRTTIEPSAYVDPVWVLLRRYFQANAYTLEYDEFLTLFLNNPNLLDQEAFHEAIALLVAVELDQQNPAIEKIVHDAIYENNGLMNHAIIMGLFYSKQPEYWQMAGDLLKAAKLQEGLRQAVLEACSDGRIEAFKLLVTIIHEEDLLRYASTVRAFDTWTLLGLEAARPETVKRAFSVATEFLGNPDKVNAALNNDNPLQIYLALWAIANTEVHTAANLVEQMLYEKEGALPEKCAALAFLRITGIKFSSGEMLELLQKYRREKVLCAYLWQNFVPEQLENPTDEIYQGFKALLDTMPEKPQKIQSPIFEWQELELSKNQIWITLVSIAEKANRAEIYDDLFSLMPDMPTEIRHYVVDNILEYIAPSPAENQHGLRVHLGSRANEDAAKRKAIQATPKMREMVFQLFSDKSIPIREHAASIARRLKLSEPELLKVEDLLSLKSSNIRKEALATIRANGSEKPSAARLRASGNDEKIAAANELNPEKAEHAAKDMSNGFGLFDPNRQRSYDMPPADQKFHPRLLLEKHRKKALSILSGLDRLLAKHRNDEILVKNSWGQEYTTLDEYMRRPMLSCDIVGVCDNIPEEIKKYLSDQVEDMGEVFAMLSILAVGNTVEKYLQVFYGEFTESPIPFSCSSGLAWIIKVRYENTPEFITTLSAIIPAIAKYTPKKFWNMGQSDGYYSSFPYFCMPPIRLWWTLAAKVPLSDEFLACLLVLHRHFEEKNQVQFSPYTADAMQSARDKGLIDDGEIARYLLSGSVWSWSYAMQQYLKHPATENVVQKLLDIELERGEMPTELSKYMIHLPLLRGAENLVRLLAALGKYKFARGYIDSGDDKSAVFSHLVKISVPLREDNVVLLSDLLSRYSIPDKRLLEAAMYAPAWLEIVSEYLKIPELPLAGWYFHAHINENFSAEKETAVARYSAITPQDFNDGAFDIDWFREAYQAVGAEMFAKLYDAAKYISGGANHRRSQIFADAALGKLKVSEVEANMATKRNKEFVMAYGILPGTDFLHRYENLMKFKKETRQFGGQRQASEKLAVEIAVANLARTAGFSDVNRFLWRMEAAKLDELNALFAPHETDGVTLSLAIDSDGRAEIQVEKAGKELKSIPASLKKDAYVLELQSAVKSLRDQHSRAKKSLEEAMIREDVFEYAEVRELMSNPVLGPLVSKLLWQSGETIDFFENLPETPLKIAHPTGLLCSGRWAEFQRLAVERKLVQPFKQIFRELYTLNADEKLDGMKSGRYSGNQVMPKKAVALLRMRGWTVDMEEGLQKVFHKQNLIAKIYAIADWFSPSEVEPPTLEYVQFEHRRTGEIIPLETIAQVLFSEVMRDLDLMVSVAHAGGVDPEASHSTVEMRAALVSALLPLFKLDNVRIEKSHAFITGKFGEYTVHLGSGVCHQQARGMLNILPVHSQTRGRLFLPFADDDPKTAEILTKILFLAEDTKIKDPNILEQIRGGVE